VRRLFRGSESLHATAGAVVLPANGACAPGPIDTLSFTLYQSSTAFGLTPKAVYFICFSPAFIFENLARGPPAQD